ncbi:MAG: chromosome segregation protein SMC [Bryobacterales bacterium]|nr:chromosome segregation protein SMC [Bryobacterales bacterium]
MLRLKRVEIQGFKSFCDRTELRFNGAGIAAVVGPNGCGKSNLSDAISWVLGEQSAKSLRGARMEDVIFAGTRDRKPLGMASVTLTLASPQEALDANIHTDKPNGVNGQTQSEKPQEITITRRLYRSGESEYLINGKQARLRDIQDLFMGTGLGPESYAIIEQGRIGQILSSKPGDRRAVIEEAAGITKFKTKRRLAEAKLEGAKQNLTRVFDILEEVSRQVNSLKRQAAKAKRYEELKSEMMGHLRRSLTGRFRMLEREAAKTALDLGAATSELEALTARLSTGEQEQVSSQELCYQTEAELTEARKALSELKLDAERTRSRLEYQSRQTAGLEQRMGQGETETQELEQRAGRLQHDLEEHARKLSELEQQSEEARRKLAATSEDRERIQNLLRARQQGIETARQQVLRLMGEASALKNQLAQIEEFLASMSRDTARAEKEAEQVSAELDRVGALKKELQGKLEARQLELQSIAGERRTVEEELSVRRNRAVESRRTLDQLRSEVSRLKARRDSLEEVLSHRTYTTESVKLLFKAVEKGQAQGLKPAGVLADFVEVEPAYEKAAEEFLHDELEYVVVKDWGQAEQGIDVMRAGLDGRATFLVHPEPGARFGNGHHAEPSIGPETGILARLSDVLKMTNGLTHAPAALLPRLARCFLAEDRATAQRLALQYPDFYFLLADGVCYNGHAVSGGRKTGSGPLALKRELREVRGQVQEQQKQFDQTTALVEDLEREIASFTEDLERLRGLQQSREKDTLALEHEMRKVNEETNRLNSRLSVARLELQRLERERERSAEQAERNRALVEEKEQARQTQEKALAAAREELENLQSETARITEDHSAVRVELAGLEERRRAEQSARQRAEHQLREVLNRRENISRDLERMGVERARLLQDNMELDRQSATLAEEMLKAEASVNRLAAEEQRLRAALAQVEETLRQMRAEADAARERRSQFELAMVKKQAELKYLDETSRKELNASLEDLAQVEEVVLEDEALYEAEQRHQEVRSRIEALGPVNPQALEEFQEAQQRYDFLNAQRQDLLDSIRDTERAIQDIDTESRKRFGEAFERINEHFRQMFKTLFGGGIGEMRLTDEANLNESGIEIVASPPGKKLQNVLLLSGGEKALTAVALLMAIFRYQPSPFCIMDEVDAPLDEANVGRLTQLVGEMSAQTQFIMITHAKKSMEAAQALYGVTMQEPGVSKIVSVKFQPAPPPPETVARVNGGTVPV